MPNQERTNLESLVGRHCRPCEGATDPLSTGETERLLGEVTGWSLDPPGRSISRLFGFKDFYETIAFVNRVAWIANQQDHHPELEVSYQSCRVRYSTHAIRGLSENDFICAARVNAIFGS
jgi:4a-hydroxytetrahydrobiopterin dehydratase